MWFQLSFIKYHAEQCLILLEMLEFCRSCHVQDGNSYFFDHSLSHYFPIMRQVLQVQTLRITCSATWWMWKSTNLMTIALYGKFGSIYRSKVWSQVRNPPLTYSHKCPPLLHDQTQSLLLPTRLGLFYLGLRWPTVALIIHTVFFSLTLELWWSVSCVPSRLTSFLYDVWLCFQRTSSEMSVIAVSPFTVALCRLRYALTI